jgi:hypothetical protein
VSNNSATGKILEKLKTRYIILDGSNSNRFVSYIAKKTEGSEVTIHSVARDGAFIF